LLLSDKSYQDTHRKQQRERLQQRLEVVRHRVEQAYMDKLDGKITEEFWARQSAQWEREEEQIHLAMQALAKILTPFELNCRCRKHLPHI